MSTTSVLDLTLTKGKLSRLELNWHTIEIGLDHLAISITIPLITSRPTATTKIQAFDTRKADWDLFKGHLT